MASKWITTAGAGGKTGADWDNAYDSTSMQAALDQLTAGDTLHVKAGTYNFSVSLDIDINDGTISSYITVLGYNGDATPAVDGTQPVFDFSAGSDEGLYLDGTKYWRFENLKIQTAAQEGIECNASTDEIFNSFVNVTVYNCSGDGFDCNNRSERSSFINCLSQGNGGKGWNEIESDTLINCSAIDNVGQGFHATGESQFIRAIAHGNSIGFKIDADASVILCSTIDENDDAGVSIITGEGLVIVFGCRITNHSGAGDDGIRLEGSGSCWSYANGFFNNNTNEDAGTGVIYTDSGVYPNTSMAADGYTNDAGNDFTLTNAAELRSVALKVGGQLGNVSYEAAGLNPSAAGGGGAGLGRSYPRGVA